MKTLLLLLFPTLLFAQNCKYEKNEVDKFTKKMVIMTKKVVISAKLGTIQCQGVNSNEIKSVNLIMTVFSPTSINEGDNFMIIAENDSIISLSSIDYSNANYQGGAWSLIGQYAITEEQLSYLTQVQIKSIRVYTSEGYIESEIKEKHALKFRDTLRCIQ